MEDDDSCSMKLIIGWVSYAHMRREIMFCNFPSYAQKCDVHAHTSTLHELRAHYLHWQLSKRVLCTSAISL